jgi:hypothetical protein
MLQYNLPVHTQQLSDLADNRIMKGKIDLLVLRHMARQVLLTVQTMEKSSTAAPVPTVFSLAERKSSLHRIAIYKPQELLTGQTISFVGFVSAWQAQVNKAVRDELYNTDQHIFPALLRIPGLLCYSSLELRPGRWFNLVLLRNLESGTELKESGAHQYAAYTLAPRVYAWIRLHNGVFPDGLAAMRPQLLTTKHYAFQEDEQNFRMYKVNYKEQNEVK